MSWKNFRMAGKPKPKINWIFIIQCVLIAFGFWAFVAALAIIFGG